MRIHRTRLQLPAKLLSSPLLICMNLFVVDVGYVELAKKWATDKLSNLSYDDGKDDDYYDMVSDIGENKKTLNELELDFYDEDDPNAVTLIAQSGEYDAIGL